MSIGLARARRVAGCVSERPWVDRRFGASVVMLQRIHRRLNVPKIECNGMKVSAAHSQPSTADAAAVPPDIVACALFCSIFAVAIVLLHAIARSGLDIHPWPLAANAVIAAAVLFTPALLGRFARTKDQWVCSVPVGMTIALLLPVLGLVFGWWPVLPLAAMAALGALFALRRGFRMRNFWRLACIGAPALALVYFIWLNGSAFGHIYQFEFAQLGRLYLDNVFHAAIAEMIRNFGIASIGADGVVPLPYHVGSHTWIAAVADIVQEPAIILYPVTLQVIGIPCFLFAFLIAADLLPPHGGAGDSRVIVAAIAVIVGASWLIWDKLLLSESYVFSLIPFLAGLPLLFSILLRPESGLLKDKARLGIAVALLPVVFWFKIPVGVIWAVGLGYVVARVYILGRTRLALPLLLGGAAAGIVFLLAVAAYYAPVGLLDMVRPFDFLRLYSLHFAVVLALFLAAVTALFFDRSLTPGERRLQIELLAVLTVCGNLPGSIFALDNGAYYFMNAATWVSLTVLANRGAIWLRRAELRSPGARRYLVIVIVGLVLLDPARWQSTFRFVERVAALQAFGERGTLPPGPYEKRGLAQAARQTWGEVGSFAEILRSGALFPADVTAAIERSTGGSVLKEVAAAKAQASGPVAVAIRPSNLAYWRMNADCRAQPMLLPALAGTPMLMGLPPPEAACNLGFQYGFANYGADSVARDVGRNELCARAAVGGFKSVLLLEERQGVQSAILVPCP